MDIMEVKACLHAHQFRLTHEREIVLKAFMTTTKMVTPGQLHQLVEEQGMHVGLTTVYRLLEVMTKLDLATTFLEGGEIYYTFCSETHHHHFVCLDCKQVKDVFECPSLQYASQYGTVTSHKLDLYGQCLNCEAMQRGKDLS